MLPLFIDYLQILDSRRLLRKVWEAEEEVREVRDVHLPLPPIFEFSQLQ